MWTLGIEPAKKVSVQSEGGEIQKLMMNSTSPSREAQMKQLGSVLGLSIRPGLEDAFCIVLLFISIYVHVVLRNDFKCEVGSETCMHHSVSAHRLPAQPSV